MITAKAEDELGDILFVCANIGRTLGIDPEAALAERQRQVHAKISLHRASALAAAGGSPAEATLEEMETLWQAAKKGTPLG